MKLTVVTDLGASTLLDVDPAAPLSNLPALIEIELNIPAADQSLFHNAKILPHPASTPASTTLAALGIADNDLILVRRAPRQQHTPTAPAAPSQAIPRPLPAHAFDDDPMSAAAQARIEEEIRAQNIAANLERAMELTPEAFGQVVMLFIAARLNNTPIVAFVDSGAQTSIISKACAERCGILRLMDTRFRGTARGVGTADILGRIHLAELELESSVAADCSFSVMDPSPFDILIGLDMLRKHRAQIDLEADGLRIGGVLARFLPEKDIPKHFISGQPQDTTPDETPQHVPPPKNPAPPASAPPAAAALPAAPTGGTATAAAPVAATQQSQGDSERKIAVLVALGFARHEAVAALTAAGGSEEHAASLLMQSRYGF